MRKRLVIYAFGSLVLGLLLSVGLEAAADTIHGDVGFVQDQGGAFSDSSGTITPSGTSGAWTLSSSSNGNITIDANGTGDTIMADQAWVCDGACPSSDVADGAGDLHVEDELEVDGNVRFDGTVAQNNTVTYAASSILQVRNVIQFNDGANFLGYISSSGAADDGMKIALKDQDGKGNNNLIVTTSGNYNKDFDHDTLSANPTVWIQSGLNPDTNNTRHGSFYHDGTAGDGGSFNITSGSGPVAIISTGFVPSPVTSDPCTGAGGAYPNGAVFYNKTSDYLCTCVGGADVKITDNSTACF